MKRRAGVVAALVATVMTLLPTTAHGAGVGAAATVLIGSGTITPGLSLTPAYQSITFTTTLGLGAGVAVDTQPGIGWGFPLVDCQFTGQDYQGSLTQGAGSVSGHCNMGPLLGWGRIQCHTLQFTRAGAVVVLLGFDTCSADFGTTLTTGANVSPPTTITTGAFVFVPNNPEIDPVTSYALAGAGLFLGVSQ